MSSFRTGNPRFRPTFPLWPLPGKKDTPPPLQTETRPPPEKNRKEAGRSSCVRGAFRGLRADKGPAPRGTEESPAKEKRTPLPPRKHPPHRESTLPLPTKCNRHSNRHQEKKTLSLHLHSCSRGCVLPRFRPLALGPGNAILSVFPFGVSLEGLRFLGTRLRCPGPTSHTLLLHCFSQSPLGSAHS